VWYIRLCLTGPPDASRESAHVAADTCRVTAESGLCDVLTWPKKGVAFLPPLSPFNITTSEPGSTVPAWEPRVFHMVRNVQMRLIMKWSSTAPDQTCAEPHSAVTYFAEHPPWTPTRQRYRSIRAPAPDSYQMTNTACG
jgi:hypothetical protein